MYGLIDSIPHIRSVEFVGSLLLSLVSVAGGVYLVASAFLG